MRSASTTGRTDLDPEAARTLYEDECQQHADIDRSQKDSRKERHELFDKKRSESRQ